MEEEYGEYNDQDEYDTGEIIIQENDDKNMIEILKSYNKNKKKYKTNPILNKYEKCRVLSERANQINCGSTIFIKDYERYTNAYDIAVQEFNEKLIPFIIKRPYGNGYEYWKLKDLY